MTTPQDPGTTPPSYAPGPQGYPPAGPPSYPPPGPAGYMPPPPAPKSARGPLIRVGIIVGIVVIIIVAFFLFRDRLSGDVTGLQIGDCIDEPAATTSVTDVQHQPCNAAHDGEVFMVLADPATGDYPGADHFRTLAVEQCVPAAAAYLGIASFDTRTDIDAGYFYPTAVSWAGSDRGVTCYMYRVDGAKLTGPLHGIGASPLH